MPRTVKRTSKQSATRSPLYPIQQLVKKETTTNKPRVCDATAVVYYPRKHNEREQYINPLTGRRVTEFQFRVYDLCAQIPKGYYSTYKQISDQIKGSPRAVGQALRCNPFAPLPVPCHRVLASNAFIGGFCGTWGEGNNVCDKQYLLKQEGLAIDENAYVVEKMRQSRLFTSFKPI